MQLADAAVVACVYPRHHALCLSIVNYRYDLRLRYTLGFHLN